MYIQKYVYALFCITFIFRLKDYKHILQEKLGGVRQPVSKMQTNDR